MKFGNRPTENPEIGLKKQELGLTKDLGYADLLDREDTAHQEEKDEREDLTRWQQDLEDDLEELRFNLQNKMKINGDWVTQKTLVADGEGGLVNVKVPQLLNDEGISKMMSIVRRYLNRNVMMSNLDQTTVFRMMKGFVFTIVQNLGENYDIYEFRPSDGQLIVKMLKDTVEPTLLRALNNGERKYLNTINKRMEVYNEGMQPVKKRGIFGG